MSRNKQSIRNVSKIKKKNSGAVQNQNMEQHEILPVASLLENRGQNFDHSSSKSYRSVNKEYLVRLSHIKYKHRELKLENVE